MGVPHDEVEVSLRVLTTEQSNEKSELVMNLAEHRAQVNFSGYLSAQRCEMIMRAREALRSAKQYVELSW